MVDAARLDAAALAEIVASFHEEHVKSYGFAHPDARTQIVELQLSATAVVDRPALPEIAQGGDPAPALIDERAVDFDDAGPVPTPIYDRERLTAGTVLHGPAVIEQLDTTTVITPSTTTRVDPHGILIIELEPR